MTRFNHVCMLAPAFLVTAASSAASTDKREALATEVERAVVMPKGAQPIAAYGRNYALTDRGTIIARYIIPSQAPNMIQRCAKIAGGNHPCSKTELAAFKAKYDRILTNDTSAGFRRWFAKPGELPNIFDGGCRQVNVEYDPVVHRLLMATCNGYA